jgi:hypothetical protein
VAEPGGHAVPTGDVLVHQPPLHDQAEVVHRSLARSLNQAEVDPPALGATVGRRNPRCAAVS